MIRTGLLAAMVMGLSVTAMAAEPATAPATSILKYDDGKADGKQSIGGSGEMIQFAMPADAKSLVGIRIHGSRYGMPQPPKEDFVIYILSEDGSKVLFTETAPYKLFERGQEKWVYVKFKAPLPVTGTFWVNVDFRAHQTKGVYVSYDTSSGGTHSKTGLPGQEAEEVQNGADWMIEAVVGK